MVHLVVFQLLHQKVYTATFALFSLLILCFSDSSESVRLTHEQMRIVKYQPKPDEVIKIVAFAGNTAELNITKKGIYIAPDKAVFFSTEKLGCFLVSAQKTCCRYSSAGIKKMPVLQSDQFLKGWTDFHFKRM